MLRKPVKGEIRTEDQIREHYDVERELADRLRSASREERTLLYRSVYDELFRRVPHHQQLTRKSSQDLRLPAVSWQIGLIKRFLDTETIFLEMGPGDCSLSFHVCKMVKKVYAADVSTIISDNPVVPKNYEPIITDGTMIPLLKETIDLVYSNQLMEHLHPEDALTQVQNIYNVLKNGGKYLCVTPNRLAGPWDISMYFDSIAKGLHLKEYTMTELVQIFKQVGFKDLKAYAGARGKYVAFPIMLIGRLEEIFAFLPIKYRAKIARSLPCRMLIGVRLVGTK